MPSYSWQARAKIPFAVTDKEYHIGSLILRPPRSKSKDEVDFVEIVTDPYTTADRSRDSALQAGLGTLVAVIPLWCVLTGKQYELKECSAELLNRDDLRSLSSTIEARASVTADVILVHHVTEASIEKLQLAFSIGEETEKTNGTEIARAIVWLHKSLFETDATNRFLCTWIAFNILYDFDANGVPTERKRVQKFGTKILEVLDRTAVIPQLKQLSEAVTPGHFLSRSGEDDGKSFLDAVGAGQTEEAILAFLLCVYDARCALFHRGRTPEVLQMFSSFLLSWLGKWIEVIRGGTWT